MPPDVWPLEHLGRVWHRDALCKEDLSRLDHACASEGSPGERLGWNQDLAATVGVHSHLSKLVQRHLPGAVPVRIVVFNKTTETNWTVPWHQDRVVAVREQHDVKGYRVWNRKAGAWHVEPPIELLESMIFARVHLDDTNAENGCLELALETHKHGRVLAEAAAITAGKATAELCDAERGDVLFVKALTLHRSRSSRREGTRRTLRIDYCAETLPTPLQWAL
ncbi:phytanoyl-CoA dioxygenase family protein [Pelagibius sp. Alg239-R121]|uniref:phytanoyl-CoA dioxygenase family protein n=1 Tax=Pelagibius sp. Alg239-R121 TaxID=2993448 RepID=UPI0024A76F7E|nr:phytanoyl-CoA dioxygenase family protein [Pelagibius sp. Alg239-R121]